MGIVDMVDTRISSDFLFRELDLRPNINHTHPDDDDESEEQLSDVEEFFLCVHCKGIITNRGDEIYVDGAHCHTFANPLGIVFEIMCFNDALGCSVVGPASEDFTWFKGYQWKISYCRYCLTHLGWYFMSAGGDNFFGLIEDRLMLSKP